MTGRKKYLNHSVRKKTEQGGIKHNQRQRQALTKKGRFFLENKKNPRLLGLADPGKLETTKERMLGR